MYETKTEAIKKALRAAVCVLASCWALSTMIFAPDKAESTFPPIEMDICVYHVPSMALSSILETSISASSVEEPVDVSLPTETAVNPYAELSVTDTEKALLACMAYSEAGNQSFDGQVAVIQVALNRYMHQAYSGSIRDILLTPNQFAVGNYYEPAQMEAVEAALAGEPALDLNTDVVYFSTGSLTYGSYYKTIGDHVFRTYT
jgi:hypothetical protein